MRRPRGGNAMNTLRCPSPGAELSRAVKQSPTGGETGGGRAEANGHDWTMPGVQDCVSTTTVADKRTGKVVRLRARLRRDTSESRPGENPMSGLTREPEES